MIMFCSKNNRRAVVRVSHDVDVDGRVILVEVEPLPDAPHVDAIEAAWQAARRCHPWIVGDSARRHLESSRRIALSQVNHLIKSADEALELMSGMDHGAVRRLRESVIDLRGYLPALRGELPVVTEKTSFRRAG